MRLPEDLLAGGPRLAVALLHVTVLALLGLLAWLAARRAGPAVRGAILLATLTGLLVVPLLAMLTPVWLPLPAGICRGGADRPVPVPNTGAPSPSAPLNVVVAMPTPHAVAVDHGNVPGATGKVEQGNVPAWPPEKQSMLIVAGPVAQPEAPPSETNGEPARPLLSPAIVLIGVWLIGAVVLVGRAFVRLAILYRCARQGRPLSEGEWSRGAGLLAERGVLSGIEVRESPAIASPLTLGWRRPVILLPTDRRHWSPLQRELILGHEVAHVRRRDFLGGLVGELAACLCWFHPLVRWLVGRMRLEQEYAADAWAASATNATAYIRCLARLALERGRGRGSLAPAFWRRRPEILRRIDMLRRHPTGLAHQPGQRTTWIIGLAATITCLAVAGIGPVGSASNGAPPAESAAEPRAQPTADAHGDRLPAGALARLGTTRLRHQGDVTFVAFAADGKALVTAGRDGTIRLWDLTTGKEIRRFKRPQPGPAKGAAPAAQVEIQAVMQLMSQGQNEGKRALVALAPGGRILAAGNGNVIRLWDVQTGKEVRSIERLPGTLAGLLFSPDGKTLAGRTAGGGLLLVAADTGKLIHHIKPAPRKASNAFVISAGANGPEPPGMAFTPDSKTLVAAATDYEQDKAIPSIKLWDLTTGREVRKIPVAGNGSVAAVAVAPGGKALAYGRGGVVHVCDLDTGKEMQRLKAPDNQVASLSYSRDGKILAARGRNQKLAVWDAATGKALHALGDAAPLRRSTGGFILVSAGGGFSGPETRALAISPDGKQIASASGSTVRIWDAVTGKELPLQGGHRRPPAAVRLSPDGKILISWGADQVIRRWDAATGRALGAFAAPARTLLATFSADGRVVALANADNTIRLHDTASGQELRRLTMQGSTVALAFAPGAKMIAARGGNNLIHLFDVAAGKELRQIALPSTAKPGQPGVLILGAAGPLAGAAPGLAFSPDGKLLLSVVPGNSSRALVIIDVATGKQLRKIDSPQPLASFAFSPDGRTVATENADHTVTLWETASARERGRLGKPALSSPQPARGTMAVRFVIDGVAARGVDDLSGPVGLSFAPDGKTLAVRGPGGSIRAWEVVSGRQLGQFQGHEGRIETVAFAPNGRALASGASDTTILVWDTTGLRRKVQTPQAVDVPAAAMEALWADLAGNDAARAGQSLIKLAAAPGAGARFLSTRLKPAARVEPAKIKRWIADLESGKFAVREQASVNLLKVEEQAVPALQKVMASPPSLETSNRVAVLLDRLTSGTLTPEQLRLVRAVEALELMGGSHARGLLQALAGGAPGALLTREAQGALERLGQSPGS
jgi:WD40 repeat protein/beta-lactamase regulating signal transducer with metallopeptidase domain